MTTETAGAAPIQLTPAQKLHALSDRFYLGVTWTPVAGDYYTTSRNDLELYQVIDVHGGVVRTRYCNPTRSTQVSEWPEAGFTTTGFGPKRVRVGPWVLGL